MLYIYRYIVVELGTAYTPEGEFVTSCFNYRDRGISIRCVSLIVGASIKITIELQSVQGIAKNLIQIQDIKLSISMKSEYHADGDAIPALTQTTNSNLQFLYFVS